MLLVSHGGDVGREGDGEDHQLCGGEGGSSLKSDDPPLQVQSNLRGSPAQLPDSSLDCSGSGVCGMGWNWFFWWSKSLCFLFARSPGDLLLLATLISLLRGGSGKMGKRLGMVSLVFSSHGLQKSLGGWWGKDCLCCS